MGWLPAGIPETTIELPSGESYIGIQTHRNLTSADIINTTSEPVTDDDYVRDWFYIFNCDTDADPCITLVKANLGAIKNYDITAHGD